MNERDWLTSTDPETMLNWARAAIRGGTTPSVLPDGYRAMSERMLRLWACAVCRSIWPLLADKRSRHAVEVAEAFADGEATQEEIERADDAATDAAEHHGEGPHDVAMWVADTHYSARWQMVQATADANGVPPATVASLLREIVGNPFRAVDRKVSCDGCGGTLSPWGPLRGFCGACDGTTDYFPWITPAALALAAAAYAERVAVKCSTCGGGSDDYYNTPGQLRDAPCTACRGSGTLASGALDADTLEALSDALEEAGCPMEEKCPACGGEKGHWSPAEINPHWLECRTCDGSGNIPHPLLAHLRGKGPHVRGCHALDAILGRQ